MLHRLSVKGVARTVASATPTNSPWRACLAVVNVVRRQPQPERTPTRGLSDASSSAAPAEGKRKPDWPVGTPAPGRTQTIGEAFAAMQHHARGTRKVKASVLNDVLKRVTSEEELKYATLGLEIFKTQGIDLHTKTGTLFVKACCKAGSPQAAVDALGEAGKYGLDAEGVVSANRFNFLLSQLYKAGDAESFARAVEEARSRQQSLNPRSHTLIAKFEGEVRAKAERAKVEEERVAREAEEAKAKKAEEEEEKAELKAKEAAAEEKARLKEEEENKAKEKEEATTELAGDAGVPSPEGGAEQDVSGNNAEAAAEAQDVDTKR